MKINITKKIFIISLLLIFLGSLLFAGDPDRTGTAAGVQTQVPVGTRNVAMGGADLGNTVGADAIYWNPAGLVGADGGCSIFSTQNIIADINVNYFALGYTMGNNALGFSIKTFDFGEIPETTVQNMDGTGATFSPSYMTLSALYARQMTDRIRVGVKPKVVYESLPRASATSLAFDFGIQYRNLFMVNGLNVGLVVNNIGSDMEYEGPGLLNEARDQYRVSATSYEDFREVPASTDKLPSSIGMGLSYTRSINFGTFTVSGAFINNNFENDQVNLGGEFIIADMLYVRGGYQMFTEAEDNPDLGSSVYGMSAGAGLKYNIMGADFKFGYTFRPAEYFDTNNTFSICIGF
jgi:hypothetical protein